MTIDKIFNKGNLSVRSYHACKYNGIETIVDLKIYYSKHSDFKGLRNCGEKSSIELVQLCKRFSDTSITEILTLHNLYQKGKLSVLSYNICKYSKIETIEELEKHYKKHTTFINLYQCGEKSNIELINLCNNIEILYPEESIEKSTDTLFRKVKSLNRLQRQVINRFIINNTANLKVRSRNAITLYVKEPLKLINFIEKIFEKDNFQVSLIKNVGKASIPELKNYLNDIKNFIFEVIEITEEKELIKLNNSYLIQNTFSINSIPNDILQSKSIIKLCDFLINKNAFFKENYNEIFKKSLNLYNLNKNNTLDNIAKELNITRERVRQVRNKCYEEIGAKLSFLKNFEDDLYQNYEIDIDENFIIIKDEMIDEINYIYDTKFSRNFLIYIFSIYLSDNFKIIGNIEDVLIPKQFNARNRHNWKNIYLVKKSVQEKIDLNKLCEDISVRLQEKIIETYSFNFKSYLSRFLIDDDFKILEIIKDDCETIVFEEFSLILDLDENIFFKRNTVKTASEYTFEALETLGKPSKVDEIYLKITELFPGFKTDVNKVRASLKRKDGFLPIGRKSVFGLKKWENELDNFKGGTIRSIVKEYLDNIDEPKHINDITKYVLQYRPKTNEYSILQNLKLDESKMFKFFKNSHIGVSGKTYDQSYIIINQKTIPKKRTWEESYRFLEGFIRINSRLPLSSNCPDSEEIIYRWFNVQKSKINKNKLSLDKVQLINHILNQFPNRITRQRSKENFNLDILLEFIQVNKRLPKPNLKKEQKLYNFFYRKRRLYNNKELPIEEHNIITNILRQYSNQIRSKSSLPNRYEILLEFVKENKRLPSATYEEEQNLYQFFYKQRKLYEKNELNNELTTLFISIAKEIQNIKYENTRN